MLDEREVLERDEAAYLSLDGDVESRICDERTYPWCGIEGL